MKHNNNMKTKTFKNLLFLIPFFLLLTISLILMYHAKYITNIYSKHFEKQCLWFGIGFLFIFLLQKMNTKKIFQYSWILYIINIGLLILVLLIGNNVNGAKAWLDFKYFSFQPSELMKLSYSLFLSHFIATKEFKNWKKEFIFLIEIAILFLIPSILVFLEPDTGAILFFGAITVLLLWNSKVRKRWFIVLGIISTILLGGFIYCYFYEKDFLISIIGTSFFYRMERLLDFRSGMQIENALIAIGSAEFFKFSPTKTGIYIPESPTDFAFALTANVFGIIGNVILLICYFLIDWILLNFYKNQKKKEEKLFTISFLTIFFLSQLINISMNLGLIPIIGIPLPFISYGGSSTIVLFLYLGILFSFKNKEKRSRTSFKKNH